MKVPRQGSRAQHAKIRLSNVGIKQLNRIKWLVITSSAVLDCRLLNCNLDYLCLTEQHSFARGVMLLTTLGTLRGFG